MHAAVFNLNYSSLVEAYYHAQGFSVFVQNFPDKKKLINIRVEFIGSLFMFSDIITLRRYQNLSLDIYIVMILKRREATIAKH